MRERIPRPLGLLRDFVNPTPGNIGNYGDGGDRGVQAYRYYFEEQRPGRFDDGIPARMKSRTAELRNAEA